MPYIITFFETILYHLFLTCMDIECYKNLLLGCSKMLFYAAGLGDSNKRS